jgi:hypothetical protein
MSKHPSPRKSQGGTLTAVAGFLPQKGKAPLLGSVSTFSYASHVLKQESTVDHPPVRKPRLSRT